MAIVPAPAVRPHNRGPLILLVDDDADGREMYNEYLTFKGCRVIVATDGAEGIDKARREPPDVILMDLRMPSMTGTEAMRSLKADPTFARVPIVALTAHALDGEQGNARAAGFDAVILKPCLPDDLLTEIEQLLTRWRMTSS